MDTNDRSIVSLAMVSHGLVHTYELTIPILMSIWLVQFPVTEATLGLIVSVGYGLFGLGALPSGLLSDRLGSQRLITFCLLGMGLSFALLAVASSVVMIGAAIALWGAAASVYHPAGLSLISKGVKDTGTGFAYHGMAGNAGIALGPLFTVVLLLFVEWRTAVLILAIPAFLGVLSTFRVKIDESAALAPDGGDARTRTDINSIGKFVDTSKVLFLGGFAFIFAIIVFNGLYYRGILTFLPELLSDFTTINLGTVIGPLSEEFNPADIIYIALLMVGIAGQYIGGRALDHVSVERGLLVGYSALLVIALLFVPALNTGLFGLLAVSLVLGFVLFSLQPMYQFAVAEYSSPDTRGLSYGYTYLAQFGVGAAGAAIVGTILTYGSPSIVFLTLGGFALVAAAISISLVAR